MLSCTQDTMRGEIPKHFDVLRPTIDQEHSSNTQNSWMPRLSSQEWNVAKKTFLMQ